jgi:hypothetical protein
VVSLWIWEVDARRATDEAKDKLTDLAERARLDAAKTERLRKE